MKLEIGQIVVLTDDRSVIIVDKCSKNEFLVELTEDNDNQKDAFVINVEDIAYKV